MNFKDVPWTEDWFYKKEMNLYGLGASLVCITFQASQWDPLKRTKF